MRYSLVPRPFEGRRKGLVHTVCACSVPLRILGDRILSYTCLLTNPRTCPCSQFVAGHLPLNHIVIVLFNYKQISFVKYHRLCALQAIAKDTDVKKDWRRSWLTMLPLLLQKSFSRPSWTAVRESDFLALSLNVRLVMIV